MEECVGTYGPTWGEGAFGPFGAHCGCITGGFLTTEIGSRRTIHYCYDIIINSPISWCIKYNVTYHVNKLGLLYMLLMTWIMR